MKYLRFCCHFV